MHWDEIYRAQAVSRRSWYEARPELSMQFITRFGSDKNGHIIDIGGGGSKLVDTLIDEGYRHVDVLDISGSALQHAQKRLGPDAGKVGWIHSDVLLFVPKKKYDIWHDRAMFHFLEDQREIRSYLQLAHLSLRSNGLLILATFSENGPSMCSDLPVHRYSQEDLSILLMGSFTKIQCTNVDHYTPGGTAQNFTYCAFRRLRPDYLIQTISHETHA